MIFQTHQLRFENKRMSTLSRKLWHTVELANNGDYNLRQTECLRDRSERCHSTRDGILQAFTEFVSDRFKFVRNIERGFFVVFRKVFPCIQEACEIVLSTPN